MNDFKERLQELIEENNLNRLQLANKLGITSTTINGYFNQNYYPHIEIAIKMAELFNCSLDYLFALTDEIKVKYKFNISDITKNFVSNLNVLMKKNKLSIAKTMKDLGMSEFNYYRWKAGQFPKTINLLAVVDYFDTSIDYLIGNNKNHQ